MAKIIKILHLQDKGDYALVNVLLDNGEEAVCYVGGSVEVFFHKGIIKAFVKRKLDKVPRID